MGKRLIEGLDYGPRPIIMDKEFLGKLRRIHLDIQKVCFFDLERSCFEDEILGLNAEALEAIGEEEIKTDLKAS